MLREAPRFVRRVSLNVSANQTCRCRVYAVGSAGPASTPRSARTSRLPFHLLKSCPELFNREAQRQFCIWFGRCHTYHLRHLRGARHRDCSGVLVGWAAQYLYNHLAQKSLNGWRGIYRTVRLLMFTSLPSRISKMGPPTVKIGTPRQSLDLLAERNCHVDPYP